MSNISMAELLVTDGTNVVDLLHHFRLLSWQPIETPLKGGGVFQTSPLGDGSRMVARNYDNAAESYTLAVKAGHQNSAIKDLRRLRGMLESAANYWSNNWSTSMVWIEARSGQEINRRFATIMSGSVPSDPAPYSEPFAGRLQAIGIIQFNIERGHWLDVRPGTDTALPIGTIVEWNPAAILIPPEYGNTDADVIDNTAFINPGGKWVKNNITHVFINGAGANMLDSAVDYTIFDAKNYTYFGCVENTDIPPKKTPPLTNLVFSVDYPNDDVERKYEWSYYDLYSGWTVIDPTTYIFDGHDIALARGGFYPPGQSDDGLPYPVGRPTIEGVVLFALNLEEDGYPAYATNTVINGVDAKWIRCRNTDGALGNTPIQSAIRKIYSITWNHIEIQDTSIGGDLDAIIRLLVQDRFYDDFFIQKPPGSCSTMVGLRTVSRGEDFQMVIPFGSAQITNSSLIESSGVSADTIFTTNEDYWSLNPSTPSTFTMLAFTNASGIAYTFGGTQDDAIIADIVFTSEGKNQYRGSYICFIMCSIGDQISDDQIDFYLKLEILNTYPDGTVITSPIYYETDYSPVVFPNRNDFFPTSMGLVKFPDSIRPDEEYGNELVLRIKCNVSDNIATLTPSVYPTPILYLDRIILVPADEWIAEININQEPIIDIDSTQDPRTVIRGLSINNDTGTEKIMGSGEVLSNGPAILHKETRQRLWFFDRIKDLTHLTASPDIITETYGVSAVRAYNVDRYKSMRGDE